MAYLAREDRRASIVAAAVALIEREGFDAVTTRAVAAEAGISPGLVHHRFADTSELIAAAWESFVARERVGFDAAGGESESVALFFDNFTDAGRSADLATWSNAWAFAQRDAAFAPVYASSFHELRLVLARSLAGHPEPEQAATRLLLLAIGLAGMVAVDPTGVGATAAATLLSAIERERELLGAPPLRRATGTAAPVPPASEHPRPRGWSGTP